MNELTLRWTHGDHSHTRTVAQGETIQIGRSPSADVVMPDDRTIHREHAEIVWKGGGPVVRVLGRNGVRVHSIGRKLRQNQETPLDKDDRLQVGGVEIRTVLGSSKPGEMKIRCHNCGRVCEYQPHEMCPHCGHALAGGQTVVV